MTEESKIVVPDVDVAQQFMSHASEQPPAAPAKPRATRKPKGLDLPPKRQKKSVRLQLVVTPDVAEALKEQSKDTGRSMNDICNIIIRRALGLPDM